MAFLTEKLEARGFGKSVWLAWMVSMSAGLLFFYEFIQMNAINSINTSLMKSFSINAHALGWLSSTYFFANASLIFVAGNLLDRFSNRFWVITAMILCTIGTIGFAVSTTLFEASVFRFIIGVGGAFCFLGGVRVASRWFPPKRMALVTGLLVTMAMFGGWIAQAPLSALVTWMGWRPAMLVDGALGIAITAWIWCVVKDSPQGYEEQAGHEAAHLKSIGLLTSIKSVLRKKQNWLAGSYTCLLNLPIYLLGGLWGTMFLTQVHHYSKPAAAMVAGMIFFGTIFGSPAMGWISDRLGSRRIPMMVAAVIALVAVLTIIYVPTLTYVELMLLFFCLGFITSSQVISYPTVAESNPRALTGTAVSIVSMSVILGGAVMQPVSGWILDSNWAGKFCGGVHCYSLSAYQHAMLIFPVAFVLGLIAVCFIKETNCKRYDDEEHLVANDGHAVDGSKLECVQTV